MLTLKLTPKLPSAHFKSASLAIPGQVTFYELHAALELILNLSCGACYSFMLMTSKHAIEDFIAAEYKIAPAFNKNAQIRYLNPYPQTFACLLELESADDKEDIPYPAITGTGSDSQINTWLKEYCHFSNTWRYHNEDFFQKEQKAERKNKKQSTAAASHPETAEPQFITGFRPKTIEQKQQILQSLYLASEFNASTRVTVGSSRYTQSQLLEASKKNNLIDYCRYSLLPVSANRRKKELAEAFTANLQENMWLTLVLLPREAIELYFRLCRLKENQKLTLNLEKEKAALELLIYLGMTDLIFGEGETDIRLELSTDYKKSFQLFFQNSKNFAPESVCTSFLSPEQKTGSWQRIVKGYEELDYRVTMLLCRYGILTAEDLRRKLCNCYGYRFEQDQFKNYLMLHLRLLEIVYTGHLRGTRQRLVSIRELNIAYALKVQESPVSPEQQRPVTKEELDIYTEWLSNQLEDLAHLLSSYTDDASLFIEVSKQIMYAVLENETWGDYLEILSELLEDIDTFMRMCFWYELSKLYLHLPVAGLGGYSRMEYAEKEHLSNPYLILNGAEDSLEDWKDMDIFGMPFDVQCELYLSAERFVKDGTELSEKRMMKYAKKQIGSEMAAALQIHCCLISGNPRLLTLLEKGAKRGNAEAREMLEEVKSLLDLDD